MKNYPLKLVTKIIKPKILETSKTKKKYQKQVGLPEKLAKILRVDKFTIVFKSGNTLGKTLFTRLNKSTPRELEVALFIEYLVLTVIKTISVKQNVISNLKYLNIKKVSNVKI